VRDVIHRFDDVGLACLDPRWAGGRPRLLSDDDEDFVIQTATTRPTKLGQPFHPLVEYANSRPACASCTDASSASAVRPYGVCSCAAASPSSATRRGRSLLTPERDAKLGRIEHILERFPDRVFAFDEFGPCTATCACAAPTNARHPDVLAAQREEHGWPCCESSAPIACPASQCSARSYRTSSRSRTTAGRRPRPRLSWAAGRRGGPGARRSGPELPGKCRSQPGQLTTASSGILAFIAAKRTTGPGCSGNRGHAVPG
jgi:hypothetical protein